MKRSLPVLVLVLCFNVLAFGWGDEGHKLINKTAVSAVPADMPAFFKTGGDKIIYNGPEPDRWRTVLEPSLKNDQEPDHYIDMERVSDIGEFPVGRYDFIRWLTRRSSARPTTRTTFFPSTSDFNRTSPPKFTSA